MGLSLKLSWMLSCSVTTVSTPITGRNNQERNPPGEEAEEASTKYLFPCKASWGINTLLSSLLDMKWQNKLHIRNRSRSKDLKNLFGMGRFAHICTIVSDASKYTNVYSLFKIKSTVQMDTLNHVFGQLKCM